MTAPTSASTSSSPPSPATCLRVSAPGLRLDDGQKPGVERTAPPKTAQATCADSLGMHPGAGKDAYLLCQATRRGSSRMEWPQPGHHSCRCPPSAPQAPFMPHGSPRPPPPTAAPSPSSGSSWALVRGFGNVQVPMTAHHHPAAHCQGCPPGCQLGCQQVTPDLPW